MLKSLGSHLLLKSIGGVGGGDFRGMSEMEVEVWNECMRLIALIIIFYNMNLLSKLLSVKKLQNDEAAIKFLAAVSPVASQHFNLSGLYEFSEDRAEIDVDAVVAMMDEILNAAGFIRNSSVSDPKQFSITTRK